MSSGFSVTAPMPAEPILADGVTAADTGQSHGERGADVSPTRRAVPLAGLGNICRADQAGDKEQGHRHLKNEYGMTR